MVLPTKRFSDAGLDWGFLVSEPSNNRVSREQAMIGPVTDRDRIVAGTVFGTVVLGAATAVPQKAGSNAANTGTGTIAMDAATPVLADAAPGVYQVTFTGPTTFTVEKPNGDQIGEGATGQAFSDDVKFTITAGATAFVAGDGFKITVAPGSGLNVPLSIAALNGGQIATKIIGRGLPASAQAQRGSFVTGPGVEVNGNLLLWPAGISAQQKAACEQQLAAKGIKVRY